jgi:hypothetical protein
MVMIAQLTTASFAARSRIAVSLIGEFKETPPRR